jgi:hypothetical protein
MHKYRRNASEPSYIGSRLPPGVTVAQLVLAQPVEVQILGGQVGEIMVTVQCRKCGRVNRYTKTTLRGRKWRCLDFKQSPISDMSEEEEALYMAYGLGMQNYTTLCKGHLKVMTPAQKAALKRNNYGW